MIQKYINLDPSFDPFDKRGMLAQMMLFSEFTFKGGEPHIKVIKPSLNVDMDRVEVLISHRIHTYNDLGRLEVAVNAIKGLGFTKLYLTLPYFPGARQDRRMVEGEPFTSAVYVKALSRMGFLEIASLDMHSDVVAGMFAVLDSPRTFHDINNHNFVGGILTSEYGGGGPYNLVSPDAGSNKKISSLGKFLVANEILPNTIVKCDKYRDVTTGEILGFDVYADDLEGIDCVIVDDICDGGGTFLGLAKELKKKGAGKIHLIVTHGIFSKGIKILTDVFDSVHCTNSFDPLKYHEGIVPKKLTIHPIKLTA